MKLLIPYQLDEELGYESVWVRKCGNDYKLDNIPFLAKGLALNDIVEVSEENGVLYFENLLRPSGHSTIRILFATPDDISNTGAELLALGCDWEGSHIAEMIAVDVPPNLDYSIVKTFLEKGSNAGTWEFQEACLGFK